MKRLAALLLVGAGIVTGGLVYLDAALNKQPVSLEALRPAIAESLSARAGKGYTVTIGKTFLAKEQGRPTITIDGLRLVGENGEAILSAPKAIASLDWAALLTGSVRLRRLALARLDLHVRVDANGALSVSAGNTKIDLTGGGVPPAPVGAPAEGAARPDNAASEPPLARTIAVALGRMFALAEVQGSALSSLRHVGIAGGRLIFEDLNRNRSTTFDGLNMELSRQSKAIQITLAANSPSGRWHVKAGIKTDDIRRLDVDISNVTLDEMMLAGGLRELPFDFDMAVSASLRLQLETSGGISAAEGKFRAGRGYFLVRNRDFEPVLVDRLNGAFRWDQARKQLRFEGIEYVAGGTDLALQGHIAPAQNDGGLWRVALETSRAGKLANQKARGETVAIGKLQFDAVIDPARKLLSLERFALNAPDANVLIAATYDFSPQNRLLQLTARADPMPVDRALSIWPSFVAAPARGWVLQNLSGGRLDELRAQLNFGEDALKALAERRHLPENSMDISYKISGASLTYLKGVAPAVDVIAHGRTRGPHTTIELKQGRATAARGKQLPVLPSTIKISDRAPQPATAHVDMRLSGPLKDVAGLLAEPGLAAFAPPGVDLSRAGGKMDAALKVDFLLGGQIKDPQVRASTRAKLSGLTLAKFLGPASLENGNLDLSIDGGEIAAKGTGRLLGAPATIAVSRQGKGPMLGSIGLTLDAAARKRLGWNSGDKITGPVGVKIGGPVGYEQGLRGDVTLDLTKAALNDLVPGFDKPAGQAATASFKLVAREGFTTLNNFVFRSQGVSARGSIELGENGVLNSARLSHLKISPGDELRADIKAVQGGMRVTLSGAAIDLRPFLARKGPAPGSADSPVQLSIQTRIATGFNGRVLSKFKLDMAADKSGVSKFLLNASAGRSPVQGRLLQSGDGTMVELMSSDAGTVLSFMDVYNRMEGGRMNLRARVRTDTISGTLDVRNFVLRNEPAMRQLVARGTNDQVRAQINANAVRFEKLQFAFQRGDGRLAVQDGILNGPEIGLTLDGMVDFRADRVAMNGTFVPAYGLNNAFARIPLFGPILGGGRNEGLLGVTFRVTGRASAPILNINPLSAIAPGFLRKIFGAVPAQPQAPSAPVPRTQSSDMPLNLGQQR